MKQITINPISPQNKGWVDRFIAKHWGSAKVAVHGMVYYPQELPGFLALIDGDKAGLITYLIQGNACEIVTLNSEVSNVGIGTGLIEAVRRAALDYDCTRLWLITTNDNMKAIRFYQKRGFRFAKVHKNGVDRSRELKPEIPLIGDDNIPMRDEIELEMVLGTPD